MLIAVTAIAAWLGLLVAHPCFAVIVLLVVMMVLLVPSQGEFMEH
jgi:hypothetical protein